MYINPKTCRKRVTPNQGGKRAKYALDLGLPTAEPDFVWIDGANRVDDIAHEPGFVRLSAL
jgi:hypothetical protein